MAVSGRIMQMVGGGGALGQCSGNIIAEFGVVSRNGTPTFITIDTIITCVKYEITI